MKKNAKLALSKETLRALTQDQLPKVHGREAGGMVTTSLDPDCFYTTPSYRKCP